MNEEIIPDIIADYAGRGLLPGVSVDCVIIGFHDGVLRVLLNKFDLSQQWMLPGGFVFVDEDVDAAAYRILKQRTMLDKIYLTQFHLFGSSTRTKMDENEKLLVDSKIDISKGHWLLNRFVSVGYYALVDFSKVKVQPNDNESVAWFDLSAVPHLYSDHNAIIDKALATMRKQMGYVPFGYELLPEKFTMSQLRVIYETISGTPIDRRNFQRRMLSSGFVVETGEVSRRWGVKDSALFSFDEEKYKEILKDGLLFSYM